MVWLIKIYISISRDVFRVGTLNVETDCNIISCRLRSLKDVLS